MIERADEILNIYEKKNVRKETFTQTSLFEYTDVEDKKKSPIEESLEKIDPLEMTPMEALNYLYDLKKEMKENK